ncbi:Galactose mutarotase [Rhizobiales bacterium GAS191]|nr:Galactose mutarotase [Rhizobiales bacterium GAS113]SEC29748.1 Galactose mutarotase [Rhizobiales bacterium GAS191]SEC95020.1 Galactose mutarotase [Rhizobiales bacterium GAS188]
MTDELLVRLATASSSASISRLGAEPQDWLVGGRSLLWSGDPAWWGQRSPILFPVVGWTRNGEMRIKGKRHPLALHGFAARQTFELLSQTPVSASLRLTDNEATRALYPFGFELSVDYRLDETTLSASFTVQNRGKEPMPYALGLHPGFAWPLAGGRREDHRIVFGREVSRQVPVIAPGGLISARRRELPLDGRTLKLTSELFANDALCFLDAASTDVAFENGSGEAIAISVEDFPHVALWTKPGAPFLCVECWTGHSDPEGFEGDIFDKPSMRVLEADASARHGVTYSWRSAR